MKNCLLQKLLIAIISFVFFVSASSCKKETSNRYYDIAYHAVLDGYAIVNTYYYLLPGRPNLWNNAMHIPYFTTPDKVKIGKSVNLDALFSTFTLDLRQGPVEIMIPEDTQNRYFSLQVFDLGSNGYGYYTNQDILPGGGKKRFIIAPYGYSGELPSESEAVIKYIPTKLAYVPLRLQACYDPQNTTDEQAAAQLQAKFVAKQYDGGAFVDPGLMLESKLNAVDWMNSISGEEFFDYLFLCLDEYCYEAYTEAAAYEEVRAIPSSEVEQVNRAYRDALARIAQMEIEGDYAEFVPYHNQWMLYRGIGGMYDGRLDLRSLLSYTFSLPNESSEAFYLFQYHDSEGNPLNGANEYTLTFSKDQIPQVECFWSLTLFKADKTLCENESRIYNLSSQQGYVTDSSGNLIIRLSSQCPAQFDAATQNWIPTPAGLDFNLTLRIYRATEEYMNQGYKKVPVVIKDVN